MVAETWSWSQIARNINKCTYRTRKGEYTRFTAKITKSFQQNMGFFKCFSVNLLSLLPSILSLSGSTHRNNFSDVVNDVMLRRSVKGCSVLAILRGLYIGGATFHRPFPFSLLWWRCNAFRSSRIRVHPTPSPIQVELSWTSSDTPCLLNSTPTRLKLVCLEYGNRLTDFWLGLSGHVCGLASRVLGLINE